MKYCGPKEAADSKQLAIRNLGEHPELRMIKDNGTSGERAIPWVFNTVATAFTGCDGGGSEKILRSSTCPSRYGVSCHRDVCNSTQKKRKRPASGSPRD